MSTATTQSETNPEVNSSTNPSTNPATQRTKPAEHDGNGSAQPARDAHLPPEAPAQPEVQAYPESPLPFSTPDLFQLLAALDFDPIALATHLDHQLLDILVWYESPEVQDVITRYEAFEDRMLELRAKRSKRTAIDTLETVIKTSEGLPERRRAATTLLRALNRSLTHPPSKPRRNNEPSDDASLLDDSIRSASRAVAGRTRRRPPTESASVDNAADAPSEAEIGADPTSDDVQSGAPQATDTTVAVLSPPASNDIKQPQRLPDAPDYHPRL